MNMPLACSSPLMSKMCLLTKCVFARTMEVQFITSNSLITTIINETDKFNRKPVDIKLKPYIRRRRKI